MELSKLVFKYPLILIRYAVTTVTSIIGLKLLVLFLSPAEFGLLNYKLSLITLTFFITEIFNYSYLYNIGAFKNQADGLQIVYICWKTISITILALLFFVFTRNLICIGLFVAWSLNTLFLTLLYGKKDIYHTQIAITIDECLQPILFLVALLYRNGGDVAINSIILAFILSSTVGSVYLLPYIKNIRLKIPSIKMVLQFFFISGALAFILNYELIALNLDKYILSFFTDFEAIGLYSGAQKLALTPYMIVNAFLLITLPITHDERVLKLLKIISGFIIGFSIFIIALFSPFIFRTFLTSQYHNPLLTIGLLIPAIFISMVKITAIGIKDYKALWIKSVFVFGMYIVLGMYLTAIFGIWGIALTQNISAFILYALIKYDFRFMIGGYT